MSKPKKSIQSSVLSDISFQQFRSRRMNMIIPLIGSAAAAAVAFFTYKAVKESRLLEDQYKQVRDTAAKIPGSSKYPATILVLGFENHGRSSFVNSVFRVLYREEGPLIMRAEAGPLKRTTTSRRLFSVKNKLLRYPKYLLNIIDAPTFSSSGDLDQDALRKLLREENQTSSPKQRNSPAPECVVLIIRSDDAYAQGPAYEKLPEVVQLLREEGIAYCDEFLGEADGDDFSEHGGFFSSSNPSYMGRSL